MFVAAEDVGDRQRDLQLVQQQLDAVQKKLAKKSGQQSKLQSAFKKTELEISELVAQQRELKHQQRRLGKQMDRLAQEKSAIEGQLGEQQQRIEKHLRTAYAVGRQHPLQLMLENGNPADIDRQLNYLARINRARFDLVESYRGLLIEKSQLESDINGKQDDARRIAEVLNTKHKRLAMLQQKRNESLTALRDEILSANQRLVTLEKDSEELQALINAMTEVRQRAKPNSNNDELLFQGWPDFAAARGKLNWPIDGEITQQFGKSRKNSDVKWQGVTISATSGTDVKAIFPGRVIFADWFQGQGLLIIVDHGQGYWSLYGHNQSLLQRVGSTVEAGEAIATVGRSGGRDVAALYFEIRHHGKPTNPGKWFSKS